MQYIKRFGALLFGLLSGALHAQQVIPIGMSVPLSGGNAAMGKDISEGAQAYFKKVNAEGGVQGRAVSLVLLDDKNDRTLAGANAQTLISENKVVILFGFASATLSLDAIPLATTQKIAIFAPITGADTVRKPGLPVYTIRASYAQELERIAAHWASLGFTRAAVIHYADEVGQQNLQTAVASLTKSGKTAVGIPIKRNVPITQKQIDAVIAAQTPVVINTVLFGQFAAILKGLRETKRSFLTSTLSFVGPSQLVDTAKTDAAGVVVAHVVPFPGNVAIPIVRECSAAMQAAGYGALNFTSLESCIGAKILTEAIKRVRGPITKESVQTAIDGLGRIDVGGYVVSLSGDAHHGSSYVDLSIVGKSGSFRN